MTGQAPYPGLLTLKPGSHCCANTVSKLTLEFFKRNASSFIFLVSPKEKFIRRKQKQKKKERKKGGMNGEREKRLLLQIWRCGYILFKKSVLSEYIKSCLCPLGSMFLFLQSR